MATLTLDSVNKIYNRRGKQPVHAVRSVDMALEDGEIVGLLGSSGCGKTSTLRMIAGFEDVTSGQIRVGERVINDLRPAERNIAMAFEGYALYPPLKIRDNIAFGLLRDRMPRAEVDRRVAQIAALLEITDILDRYPPTISGGQQQRTSLARALVRRAQLWLLDEPMSQLEPQLRAVLRARIKDYLIEHRMTTVFVTHDQTEALALADRIAVMEAGELRQLAAPAQLKERPADLFVASFIGEPPMNVMLGRVQRAGGAMRLEIARPDADAAFAIPLPGPNEAPVLHERLAMRDAVHVGIRPHRIEIAPDAALPARVVSNQWLGDQTHLGLDVAGILLIVVADAAVDAAVGARVQVDLPATALHLFDAATGKALTHGLEPA
jgi:multiple sugar transport system ATP-binding protein